MRYWSLLFALGAVIGVGVFVYAPFSSAWWLPNPADTPYRAVSSIGREVDWLFMIILWITGAVFIGVMAVLVWTMWAFVDRPGRKAAYFHGSLSVEVVWTLIPAVILVFIAYYQLGTWARIKMRRAAPDVPPIAEVTGRQFQWLIRYPGPDKKLDTADDLQLINDFHFVKGTPTLIDLKSSDVIHSFFLPEMRIKQDAVPGLTIPVWFDSDREGKYELVCAELCGWGHYKMRAVVTVHATDREFQEWQTKALAEQNRSQLAVAAPAGNEGK